MSKKRYAIFFSNLDESYEYPDEFFYIGGKFNDFSNNIAEAKWYSLNKALYLKAKLKEKYWCRSLEAELGFKYSELKLIDQRLDKIYY